jgi:hypothetical protein
MEKHSLDSDEEPEPDETATSRYSLTEEDMHEELDTAVCFILIFRSSYARSSPMAAWRLLHSTSRVKWMKGKLICVFASIENPFYSLFPLRLC